MKHLNRAFVILLTGVLLGACGALKVGRDFDVGSFVTQVKHGVTTQSEVRAWLGDPTSVGASVGLDGEHFVEWTYYHALGQMSDMSSADVKLLQIKFDGQARVSGYNWSASK